MKEGRKEGRREGEKEGRKVGRKEKEGRRVVQICLMGNFNAMFKVSES